MTNALASFRIGRCVLHALCALRRPGTARFHRAGISSEWICDAGYYPTPGPLLPIAVAAAMAMMVWWVRR